MIKITTRTILSNIIKHVIGEWKMKLPDKSLEEYDNWKEDILDAIELKLSKQGISLDEILIDETSQEVNE